jgi:hypothetical protein
MPFHLINSSSSKYSSIEFQKFHEYEYKKFLKTLPEQNLLKHRKIDLNNNYLNQRQIHLQYRQNKRKYEYERIQKENLRFSQRLMNAKAFLNRDEQEKFFEKHWKLKQRLQHYPDLNQNQTKKSTNHFQIINKPFFIYNDNHQKLPQLIKHNPSISKTFAPNLW